MPVADVREFVQLGGGTLDVHPIRLRLLEQQTAAIQAQLAQLHEDLAVVQAKTAEYRRLIALGLDCEDDAAADAVA